MDGIQIENYNFTLNQTFYNENNESDISFFSGMPTRDPLYIVIPVTIIYIVIFITGVVGNVSTCIVISRNRSMHTATNYYLFSLAISDLLLLVSGLPPEIYLIWSKYPYVFGEIFCVLRGLAAETSANATVLTITAFTVERYVAICHPFLSHTMSKLSRAVKLIVVIWLVALAFATPQALQFGIVFHHGIPSCSQKRIILEHSFELSTFLFFVTPMTLITVLYALIGLKLRSSNMMNRERSQAVQNRNLRNGVNRRGSRKGGTSQSSRRVLKMLVAVVVAFFICWAPFHAQRLVAIYGINSNMHTLYDIMTYISGVLYYLSTTINPLLYHIMSNKFREAFKETIARWCSGTGGASDGVGGGCGGGRGADGRRYSALSRCAAGHNIPRYLNPQDSTDYSGNSIREDSFSHGGSASEGLLRSTSRGDRSLSLATGATSLATDLSLDICAICKTSKNLSRNTHSCKNSIALSKLHTENVTYKNDFPASVHIHFSDKETNTGLYESNVKNNAYCLNKSRFSTKRVVKRKRRGIWYILKCVSYTKDVDYDFSPSRSKLTVESETQTDNENFLMNINANLSDSNIREIDSEALSDELTSYMEELHRREQFVNSLSK